MRRFLCVLLIILFLLFRPAKCLAVDFKSDYKVDYYLEESDNKVRTKVKFTIDITNLRSDVYVKKVTLSFPNDFAIKNLSASDNTGVVIPQVEYNTDNIDLQLEFNNPNVGRESINTFYLNFEQDNLVQKNGYIWEIILPTINKETRNQYKVTLHIPELSSKKISLSKPRPDEISATEVIWNNPTAKTIYITLGDRQFYHAQLGYHLKNDQLVPIYTDVAFPPDTLYQKTYVKFIHPKPAYVYMDADGNYLGRYLLNPRQTLDITYDGFIESFINPREEVMSFERNQIELQKKYLFNFDKNWDLKDKKINNKIKSVSDIYYFTTTQLTYDYTRSVKNNLRLGAYQALSQPTKAVCVEFSDLFVALAREKGIYAREIQGFAYSQNQRFRPITLSSDILHSWPEYYDTNKKIWIPVDPTWENTSGIDYFNSFDFNHIVFAIHGKKSDYPLAAGMYKTEESKEININAVESKADDLVSLSVDSINAPSLTTDKGNYQLKFTLINNSNIFLWNVPIKAIGKSVIFSNNNQIIYQMAPYEKRNIVLNFSFGEIRRKTLIDLQVLVMENQMVLRQISVYPYYYDIILKLSYIVIGFTIIIIIVKLLTHEKSDKINPR